MGQKPAKQGAAAPAKAKPKRPNGRPPYKPTDAARRQVLMLVGLGLREDEIAKVIEPPCDPKTLRLRFRHELDRGLLQAKVQTLGTLHRLANGAPAQYYPEGHANAGQVMFPAVSPDRACLIFKCKTAYGMRETIRIGGEQGPGAKPVSIRIEDLSEDQLVALITSLEALESRAGISGDDD